MAKKKSQKNKPRPKTPKSKRHLHAVRSAPKSTTAFRNSKELDALTPAFISWFTLTDTDTDTDARAGLLCLEMVRFLIDACAEREPSSSATDFPAWAVVEAVDAIYSVSEGDPDSAEPFVEAWHFYLHFLDDTDRWKGSSEQFEAIHSILSEGFLDDDDVLADDDGRLPEVEVPDLSEAEQVEGFAEVALIQRTGKLLEWIGTGREVTQTGVLRLKDIAAAAARVEVRVRPVSTAQSPAAHLPGLEEDEVDEAIPQVRSMHHVPLLNTIWAALRQAGLITVSATTARPTARTEHWLHGSAAGKAAVYREFVTAYLGEIVTEVAAPEYVQETANSLVMLALVAGTTNRAMPRDRLEHLGSESTDNVDFMMQIAVRIGIRQLGQLTDLGLLQPGPDYVSAPVVAQCIAAVLDQINELGDAAEADAGGPAITQTTDSSVFRIKVTLAGSKPPIWRRLLVPSSIRLNELHTVIQRSFDWDNSHLHSFYAGSGRRMTTYGPVDTGFGPDDIEETIDESTVALGELIRTAGSKVTYLYDFGDSWEHLIELEDVLDEDTEDLPACTAGRGAAPLEDSGGIPGWYDIIAAAHDPSHDMHEDFREWLDLAPGESFDASAFDLGYVNKRLSVLR